MGISSKKTTQQTTQNQNTNMTTTPVNPDWVKTGLEGAGGRISDFFSGLDPSSLVAGPDALQTQAAQGAAGLSLSPLFTEAGNAFRLAGGRGPNTYAATTGQATTYDPTTGQASLVGELPQMRGESLLDNLQAYMSPYTKDVVDTSLADFDYGAGQQEGQAKLDLAGDATFGGSGGSIGLQALRGELSRGRGALSANLRDQGFQRGAALSGQDADRRQSASATNLQAMLARLQGNQNAENTFGLANMDAANRASEFGASANNTFGLANMDALNTAGRYNAGAADTAAARELTAAGGLAGLGATMGDQQRANVGMQSDIGAILQAISQRQAGAGLGALAAEGGLWGGLPLDLLRGGITNGTMSGTSSGTSKDSGMSGSDIAQLAAAAAMAFSDLRLKQDVETVGHDAKGRRWVDYAYAWDPNTRHRGVIAQEIIGTDPHAVHVHESGYLMVDYAKLGDA